MAKPRMDTHYDIIIIGNGMVGASLACALQQTDLRVAIIDKNPPTEQPGTNDGRKIALSYGSQCILDQFSVWPTLTTQATPITQVHISKAQQFGATHLHADDLALDALGYVVPAEQLLHALHRQEKTGQQLHFYCPGKINDIRLQPEPTVTIEHEQKNLTLSATLIVAADGVMSYSRQLLGIACQEKDYQQTALVTSFDTSLGHDNIAYQRFSKLGTLAFLPMQHKKMGFVCTGTAEQIAYLQALTDTDFLQQIAQAIGGRLGNLQNLGAQFTYPIKEIIAEQQTLPGFILLGNAAHNISPVAAQGFNLALQNIFSLLQLIMQSTDLTQVVAQYPEQVAKQQTDTLHFTDTLMEWLKTDNLLQPLIGVGLGLLDANLALKKRFATKPSGLTANVQRLRRDANEQTL